jgi:hypothetical protein
VTDRLITCEGVTLELEDRELEETWGSSLRMREVLEEFAEAQRLRLTAERPSPLWFTEFDPEANRQKASAYYHAINTERGQAYKLERLRAQNAGKWERVKADPERHARQKASQRTYDRRRRADPEKHEAMKRRHREAYHRRRQDPARRAEDSRKWREAYAARKRRGTP